LQVIYTMAKPRRTTKQSKQTGGTFLGIVLGLIVGLAIAVVVALYITRAPTPFVAKVAPPAASDTSASEAQYDPNRPLPPNTAPQPQAPGMLQEPEIVEVPPASSANANGVAVAPKPAQDNGESAQVKKPQQATSAPTSTAAAPASNAAKPGSGAAPSALDANSGYFLQVGAYKTSADAEQQRARLAFQGFESKVTQRDAGGVTYYRVRIGPFSKFDDMNSARQRLSDAGVDTAVIRFTKQ
jgi:cell division protein FtsN